MKKFNSALLILIFLLAACAPAVPATDAVIKDSPQPSATETDATPQAATSAREGVISEIENIVSIRKTSTDEAVAAEQGMIVLEGGIVETGDGGRVRVDLMPEGTIVRVGPNSSFQVSQLVEEGGEPKTTLELLFGKVFILLKGGTLSVETPSGVASVRGSLLSVEYDPETKRINAACLEGDCSLQGEDGDEIDIPEGEASFIDEGELPMEPFPMDQDEVQDWLDENPDLDLFMTELPDPEDYPDLPPDFDGDMEDIPTEEVPTEEASTEEVSTEEVSTEEAPTEEVSTEEAPTEEQPTEEGSLDSRVGKASVS